MITAELVGNATAPNRRRHYAAVIGLLVVLIVSTRLRASDAQNHIAEILAGANGNSAIQFIVIRQEGGGHLWGPQPGEAQSRALLVFFDARGRETGQLKFPSNAAGPAASDVLIATAEFAAQAGAPAPDFTMPPLLNAVSGAVCFQSNPANNASHRRHCVSYGNFAGFTNGNSRNPAGPGAPAPALPITGTVSMQSAAGVNVNGDLNTEFAITGSPTPRNSAGATFTIRGASLVEQGANLFQRETFSGNGRTCASCHVAAESFGMTPANVQSRFATVASTYDPLFIGELSPSGFDAGFDFNLNTLTLAAAPGNPSPCNGELRGIITAPNGARANVVARVSATRYLVNGGVNPSLTGQVASDSHSCSATVSAIVQGNLAVAENITPAGLESPRLMRRSVSPAFPAGRALILENVDGTSPMLTPAVFRKSPHLLNLNRTAPYGFSGDVPDLRTFFAAAVNQHFPRTLARSHAGPSPDFRQPTVDELGAVEAFMQAQEFPPGRSTDKFNLDYYATTAAQRRGRALFFGSAKCSQCHGGPVLATTTVSIQGKPVGVNAAFDTGVARQAINGPGQDNLPSEKDGEREFSVPQLFNVKNLGPLFHDGSVLGVGSAVVFYDSQIFNSSPAGRAIGGISLGLSSAFDLTAFLVGLVVRPYTLTPGPLSFEVQSPGTASATQSIVVTNTGTTALTFSGLTGCELVGEDISDFTVASCPLAASPLAVGESRTVHVRFTPTSAGPKRTILEFKAADPSGISLSGAVTNTAPTITPIAAQAMDAGMDSTPLDFTISDAETDAGELLVMVTSSNNAVVPASHMAVVGSGASRSLIVTPATGGEATITVAVTDGTVTTTTLFPLASTGPPMIGASPVSATTPQGSDAEFSVIANAYPPPSFQWQLSTNRGGTWTDVNDAPPHSGAATASLTVAQVSEMMNGRHYRVIVKNSLGTVTSAAAVLNVPGVATAIPAQLQFGAVVRPGAAPVVTAAQSIAVSFTNGSVDWVATSDQPWLQLINASGRGAGVFTAQIRAGAIPSRITSLSAMITVSADTVQNSPLSLPVTFRVMHAPTSAPPFGSLDTPVNGAVVAGSIGVTGWALDDVAVSGVEIFRNCVDGIDQGNCQIIGARRLVFIGHAAFLPNARPDVEAAFPSAPEAHRAGWGYLLLTNMLPDVASSRPSGGQGPITLYAFALDDDGHRTLLGERTIALDNEHANRPFGAIDTPGQGATVSGMVANFGWALTPGSATIPTDGSTMRVVVDGATIGNVTYDQCRAGSTNLPPVGTCQDDIATLFPSFTNITNGRGAIGSFDIDTRTLSNGLHTIAWGVIDDQGRAEGIGSRFFIVLNGMSSTPDTSMTASGVTTDTRDAEVSVEELSARPVSGAAVLGRSGFDFAAPPEMVLADEIGVRHLRVPELGRLELSIDAGIDAGYLIVNGTLRSLPAGSRLDTDTGVFTWSPPPGYLGGYEIVFVNATTRLPVHVLVQPKSISGGHVHGFVDLPGPQATVEGAFRVAGWALDLDAWHGAGIGAVHVWAHRRDLDDADPEFLGAADLRAARPDVADAFGSQFERAGWNLDAAGLSPGTYDITAYFWSARTRRFEDARTVSIVVR